MIQTPPRPVCPLCSSTDTALYHTDTMRSYFQCSNCTLVFVPKEFHLSEKKEKAEYDLHENTINDPGYRKFLSRLTRPLSAKLSKNSHGLDFGCGPGPALADMLEKQGHSMALFDPIYHNFPDVFDHKYDFISATEVVEHLRSPAMEFKQLFDCLKPDGYLGIMTKLVKNQAAFKDWHYTRDLTHIGFYSQQTFMWIAHTFNADLDFISNDVIFLKKTT